MAPKRGTKRAAEEAPANMLQESLRQHGVTKAEFSGIEEALKHPLAPGLTEECRKMLVAVVPHSVCVRAAERTKQQVVSVEMVTEIFMGIMEAMQMEIDTDVSKLSVVEASKARLEAKVQETQAGFDESFAAFGTRKRTLAEAAKAVLAAKACLAEKEKAQRQGDAAHIEAQDEKVTLETALAQEFCRLRDGEVEGDEAKAAYEKLAGLAGKLGLEDSLITALPASMMKKPSERGSFDAMVVAQLEEGLTAQVARLAQAVSEGVPAAEARRAAVAAAQEQLSGAKEVQQAAADEMTAADEHQQEREKELRAAEAALATFAPEHAAAVAARDGKVEQLQSFKDWNMTCFETVRDRVGAPKKQKTAEAAPEELPSKEAPQLETAPAQVAEAGA